MNIRMHLKLVILGLLFASVAYGQTYKCLHANGKLVYSDSPCEANVRTEKILPPAAGNGVQAESSSSTPYMNDLQFLNMKVDEAIKSRDFRRARQLALTQEHWDKISKAEDALTSGQAEVPVSASKQQPQRAETQIQQQTIQQQTVNIRQNITHNPQSKQIELRELQLKMQQDQMARQEETRRIQKQVAQQQQQKEQQRQQRRQLCLSQLQNKLQNRPDAVAYAIRQSGTSAASMQALLAQNYAREAALCNSLE